MQRAHTAYPRFIHALRSVLRAVLRLELNHKNTLHFQMPLPRNHPHSIARLAPLLQNTEKVVNDVYRLAGGPVAREATLFVPG